MSLENIIHTELKKLTLPPLSHSILGSMAPVYHYTVDMVEKVMLENVMIYAKWDQGRAGVILGLNRNTVRKKLIKHRLHEMVMKKHYERLAEHGRPR